MIRVLLTDDHPIVLDGLRTLLSMESNIEIVGEAHNGREVLHILKGQKVDIVLLDIRMPLLDGIETTKHIQKIYPGTKIIILSMHDKKDHILKLMHTGISGYILKSKGSEEVVEAINKVYQGGQHFGEEVLKVATQPGLAITGSLGNLTSREKEILTLIGECKPSKKIASELHISTTTVETHIRNILAKLELDSRLHLVRYAVENGFTK